MISMVDTARVFLRKLRAAPCRERGKHIRRGYDTAPFSRRTTSSGIAFSLNDVCLSRALICGLSRGTLFPVGVVTTTANEKDAVCVHTTTHEKTNHECALFSAQTTNDGSSSSAVRTTHKEVPLDAGRTRAGLLDSGRAQELPDSANLLVSQSGDNPKSDLTASFPTDSKERQNAQKKLDKEQVIGFFRRLGQVDGCTFRFF